MGPPGDVGPLCVTGHATLLVPVPGADPALAAEPTVAPAVRVAYLVSRFPRLTETFVVEEALAVRQAGAEVDLYPLHRERATVVQPAAEELAPHVHHHRLVSLPVLVSQWRALRRHPGAYLATAAAVVRHNWGSRRLLVGAIAAFPLAVHLARTFEDRGVEHVHAHFATHPAVVAYVIGRLSAIPFSFTAHGSDLHRDRHMLAEKVRRATFVVAISDHNRQVILDECGSRVADRVVVIHCGVDLASFAPAAPQDRLGDGPVRLCCIGTLHEVKGQTHLIEAARRAADGGVAVEVSFIGGGPDREQLEAQAEAAGLGSAVAFLGSLTRPQVQAALQASDILVCPSVPSADGRREGLPVVLLEAMAAGVPVIASRLSGIPEAVIHERTGLLVDPGDVDGLAAAITRLASGPELARTLSAEAQRHVAAEFDVHDSARRLVALFTASAR